VVLCNLSDCFTIVVLSLGPFAGRPRLFITCTALSTPGSCIIEDSQRTSHAPRARYSTNTQNLRNFSMY